MRPSVAFLAGWTAACVTVAAGAFGWMWWWNAGTPRHLHRTTPRSLP